MSETSQPATELARCPVCQGGTRTFCRRHACRHEWLIDQCKACGHGFVRNRPTLNDLMGYYA